MDAEAHKSAKLNGRETALIPKTRNISAAKLSGFTVCASCANKSCVKARR
jgi:hypothetical protein